MRHVYRLLVGYDGSTQAREAARLAARLAAPAGAAVTVLCVGHVPTRLQAAVLPQTDETAYAATAAEGAAVVQALGAPAVARTALGKPADVLVEVAAREAYDLLLVGHRGRGGLSGLLLGSVAKQVAAEAPCPVVVARGAAPEAVTQILVATDGATEAQRAADAAISLARACQARITLLHVIDASLLAAATRPEIMLHLHAIQERGGQDALLLVAEACERAGVPAEAVQTTGQVADVILAQAEARGAQLIALGRSGRSGPLGHVSDAVLRQASAGVLVAGERVRVGGDPTPATPTTPAAS